MLPTDKWEVKKRDVTSEFINVSARDVRTLCHSKRSDIITTRSKIDDLSSIFKKKIEKKKRRKDLWML